MLSVADIRKRIKISPLDLASDEFVVLSVVYKKYEDIVSQHGQMRLFDTQEAIGVPYSQIVQELNGIITDKKIHRALNILQLFGLIVPCVAEMFLDLGDGKKTWVVRAYKPSGESIFQQLGKFAALILSSRSIAYDPKSSSEVFFDRSDQLQIQRLNTDCQLLGYIFILAQDETNKRKDGLSPTFAYKLTANVLRDLMMDYKSYVTVRAVQYGAIPVFPAGLFAKESHIRDLTPLGYWKESNGRIHSYFDSLKEANEVLENIRINSTLSTNLTLFYLRLARQSSNVLEKSASEILNILATSRNPITLGESINYEHTAWVKWFHLFFRTLIEQGIIDQTRFTDLVEMYSKRKNLRSLLTKARQLPYYPISFISLPQKLEPSRDKFKEIERKIIQLRLDKGKDSGNNWKEYLKLRNEFLYILSSQAARAAAQSNKKVKDYFSGVLQKTKELAQKQINIDPVSASVAKYFLNSTKTPQEVEYKIKETLEELDRTTKATIYFTSLVRASFPELGKEKKKSPEHYMRKLKEQIPKIAGHEEIFQKALNADIARLFECIQELFSICRLKVEKELFNLWRLI